MRKQFILLALLLLPLLKLFSRNYDLSVPYEVGKCIDSYEICYSEYDDTVDKAYAIKNGSENIDDFGIVMGLEGFLKRNWTTIYEYPPIRSIWEWSYDSLKVDTLSVINEDILSLLDYYDGKIGVQNDYNVWCRQFDDNLNSDSDKKGMSIDTYRKYYILRIDTLCSETIVYYSLDNRAIEDIFENPDTMKYLGEIMGYVNYDSRPILVAGSGADIFFKRDSTIIMSPTYRKRVERSSGKGDIDEMYLIGEIKGFFLYRDGEFRLCRTSFVPFWQDREFYLDDVRQRIEGSFGSFLPYRVAAPLLSPDVLKRYRTREPLH